MDVAEVDSIAQELYIEHYNNTVLNNTVLGANYSPLTIDSLKELLWSYRF